MFAAEELCHEFWAFVRYRAFDERNEYMFSLPLMELDDDRRERSRYLQPVDERTVQFGTGSLDEGARAPVVYETVQEALLDFLIDRIGTNWVPDFLDWLRAQALIMSQAAREPEWLTVRTPVIGADGEWWPDHLAAHTMKVAPGSWDSLSRETFDALVRRFFGPQDHYPLRNLEVKRLKEEAP